MLTLIHGDNLAATRKHLIDLKFKYPNANLFEGSEITLTDLVQTLEGGGLFSDEKVIFIENLLSRRKQSTELKDLIIYLLSQADNATIVMWEEKEIEKKTVSTLKNATIRTFNLPKPLFTLLDSLQPTNGKNLLRLYHEVLETVDEELVFYMLVRHFRLFIALHPQSNLHRERNEKTAIEPMENDPFRITQPIEEVKRMQEWQRTKLIKQAKSFSQEQLVSYYIKLYEIEKGLKTGSQSQPLKRLIDIFLVAM